MRRELVYSVEVAIVRCPGDGTDGASLGAPVETPTTVRYCDICRRWGAAGTTHMCWRNWRRRLSDLLREMKRDGRL
ncbi:MAG TPA: hypothetical protein VH374_12645 [Polyangia bacterium]|jgi:hypothetical protein|nr:hypothetical protein [Polyangia bacterium]